MKENFQKEKEMEKEKNFLIIKFHLKVNSKKEKNGMEMLMNIMKKEIYYFMALIKMVKNLMENLVNIWMMQKN